MTEKYFAKFPTFVYNGKLARDISRRVTITPRDRNNPYNYYPFMLRDEIRSDIVADFYYRDSEMDWLVYHVNKVIDPYYDWYNTNETFNLLLIEKYGSIEMAMQKIWIYVNNWIDDDIRMTISQFEEHIPYRWKKYYNPIWGEKAEIIGYERKKDDHYQNTNRIIQYDINYTSGNAFTIGELIDIKYAGLIIGGGECEWTNTSVLTIKNVSGNTTANSTFIPTFIGNTTSTEATSNNFTIIQESIPLDEDHFWSPIYYYEYEQMKNEYRKHINLVNEGLTPFIIQEFETKLQENN